MVFFQPSCLPDVSHQVPSGVWQLPEVQPCPCPTPFLPRVCRVGREEMGPAVLTPPAGQTLGSSASGTIWHCWVSLLFMDVGVGGLGVWCSGASRGHHRQVPRADSPLPPSPGATPADATFIPWNKGPLIPPIPVVGPIVCVHGSGVLKNLVKPKS